MGKSGRIFFLKPGITGTGSDFLAATGRGTPTKVKRFSLLPGANQPTLEEEFAPFGAGFSGGATLGGTN